MSPDRPAGRTGASFLGRVPVYLLRSQGGRFPAGNRPARVPVRLISDNIMKPYINDRIPYAQEEQRSGPLLPSPLLPCTDATAMPGLPSMPTGHARSRLRVTLAAASGGLASNACIHAHHHMLHPHAMLSTGREQPSPTSRSVDLAKCGHLVKEERDKSMNRRG